MKRSLFLVPLAGWLALAGGVRAQTLVGDAVRQEMDDRLRRTERDLETLKETNESLRRKVATLETAINEFGRLSVERDRAHNNFLKLTASKEELGQLERALKESEHRREADKKLFVEKFEALQKLIASAPLSAAQPPSHRPSQDRNDSPGVGRKTSSSGGADTGVYHLVEKNQTASEILKAYNDDLKSKGRAGKITLKQLEAANPGTDINRVRTGQKLFIPIPEK